VLVSLTECKSRLTLFAKVSSKKAEGVTECILKLLVPLSDRVHTLTSDNGKEFTHHEAIAKTLDADYYFAHPYAPGSEDSTRTPTD
jgi:IS30 family transposase